MKRLRIGIVSQLFTPLPPKHYGGIERVVCAVSDALHARGHEVTIFGPEETQTVCRSVPFGRVSGEEKGEAWPDRMRLWSLLNQHQRRLDVIHNFFRLLFLLPVLPRRVAKLVSFACPIDSKTVRMADRLGGRSIHYAVCGAHMLRTLDARIDRSKWHVVHNPIVASRYDLRTAPERARPYLVFLGRLCVIKGAHQAIEVARRVGKRLVIAGNIQSADREYFDTQVKPLIDGKDIEYIGPIDDARKNELLGGAEALLFPISWEEPFGLVVAEAMACGTPVLAFGRGAMPEIVRDGVNGYLSNTVEEMALDVGRIGAIDRRACRISVEQRFTPDAIAEAYETVYQRIVNGESSAAFEQQSLAK